MKNDKLTIGIIANASHEIGLGHLYRSLAIAQELKKNNVCIYFLCQAKSVIETMAMEAGFSCLHMPNWTAPNYRTNLENLIVKYHFNILFFDLLEKDLLLHQFLKDNESCFIASISSFEYSLVRFEDITFYLNYHKQTKEYLPCYRGRTPVYSGPEYLVFREEFLRSYSKTFPEVGKKVLITMGGADPDGFSLKAIDALEQIALRLEVCVILGRMHFDKKAILAKTTQSNHEYKIIKNTNKMAVLMSQADVAIINGGLTRYELCMVGTPFIAISLHQIQYEITARTTESGAGINLGVGKELPLEKIACATVALLRNKALREKMSKSMKNLFDGKGAKRIVASILCSYSRKIAKKSESYA